MTERDVPRTAEVETTSQENQKVMNEVKDYDADDWGEAMLYAESGEAEGLQSYRREAVVALARAFAGVRRGGERERGRAALREFLQMGEGVPRRPMTEEERAFFAEHKRKRESGELRMISDEERQRRRRESPQPDRDSSVDVGDEHWSLMNAEIQRLRSALSDFAEHDCEYGDNCPTFGSRHGQCVGCKARAALRTESPRREPDFDAVMERAERERAAAGFGGSRPGAFKTSTGGESHDARRDPAASAVRDGRGERPVEGVHAPEPAGPHDEASGASDTETPHYSTRNAGEERSK